MIEEQNGKTEVVANPERAQGRAKRRQHSTEYKLRILRELDECKGATPASEGVLGVIPGSMGDAGYVVRGKGALSSLTSASHGAGRLMSRKAAINSISKSARDEYLKQRNITLLGGGMDESPQAYKDIESSIAVQDDLVEVIGKFTPRIVRMADEPGDI